MLKNDSFNNELNWIYCLCTYIIHIKNDCYVNLKKQVKYLEDKLERKLDSMRGINLAENMQS